MAWDSVITAQRRLPDDVVGIILAHLPLRDLLACLRVSRLWNTIGSSGYVWRGQLKRRLPVAAMIWDHALTEEEQWLYSSQAHAASVYRSPSGRVVEFARSFACRQHLEETINVPQREYQWTRCVHRALHHDVTSYAERFRWCHTAIKSRLPRYLHALLFIAYLCVTMFIILMFVRMRSPLITDVDTVIAPLYGAMAVVCMATAMYTFFHIVYNPRAATWAQALSNFSVWRFAVGAFTVVYLDAVVPTSTIRDKLLIDRLCGNTHAYRVPQLSTIQQYFSTLMYSLSDPIVGATLPTETGCDAIPFQSEAYNGCVENWCESLVQQHPSRYSWTSCVYFPILSMLFWQFTVLCGWRVVHRERLSAHRSVVIDVVAYSYPGYFAASLVMVCMFIENGSVWAIRGAVVPWIITSTSLFFFTFSDAIRRRCTSEFCTPIAFSVITIGLLQLCTHRSNQAITSFTSAAVLFLIAWILALRRNSKRLR